MDSKIKNICKLVSDSILVDFYDVFAFNCSPRKSLEMNEIYFDSYISEQDGTLNVRVNVSSHGISGTILGILTDVIGILRFVSTDMYGNVELLYTCKL